MTKSLLSTCQKLWPDIAFVSGKTFYWSPGSNSVHLDSDALESQIGQWALVHEVAHAVLNHRSYNSDASLLKLEVEAWQAAVEVSKKVGITIDLEHIQECLDTYRDWLYARSTCPTCSLNSMQVDETTYCCLNCGTRWLVSHSRFCRPYRMKNRHQKTSLELSQATFQ